MFKGIGKQVVVLKNTDSKIFEEAIFIIRDGKKTNRDDMISECERIIREGSSHDRGVGGKRRTIMLLCGAAVLAAIGITAFIISLL